MSLNLITAPTEEPVTLGELKDQCRITAGDQDILLTNLAATARQYLDGKQGILGRALMPQTWDLWLDSFPGWEWMDVPLPPLQSVTSIKYYDTANVEATMAAVDYFVDTKREPGRVSLAYGKAWPTAVLRPINGVAVRFVAGYADAVSVPAPIKHAILMLSAHWFINSEAVDTGAALVPRLMALAVQSLTEPYRIWRAAA